MTAFSVGDIVILKKKHPCGSFRWEVLRVGQDIRIRCKECGRMVMLSRRDLEINLKSIEPASADAGKDAAENTEKIDYKLH